MKRLLLLSFLLLTAPAFAQVEVVAKYRASFPTPLTTDQKITLLRAVAAEVHGGLLVKHDGNNCNGYACDIICFSPTALFDVLQAEGEAALPSWNATTNPRGYACELVTGSLPPPSPLSPPSVPDYEQMLNALREQGNTIAETVNRLATEQATLATKLEKMDAEDRADLTEIKDSIRPWKDLGTFILKYIAPEVTAILATYQLTHK